jgi:hypothetical protein
MSFAIIDRRNAWCNRCYGRIGGARLFCLDCDHKKTETYETLDLCCAQECMNARITDRQDLQVAHEPSHRLVKLHTVVLERQLGRVHTAALVAFERVKILCAKIAESHQRFVEDGEKGAAGPATRNQSNPEPTLKETPTDGLPPDHVPDVPNGATVKARDGGASKGPRDENPQEGKQPRGSDSLSCNKCRGRLSFPCWYCIYCEGQSRILTYSPHVLRPSTTLLDDLFLCETCEADKACKACETCKACQVGEACKACQVGEACKACKEVKAYKAGKAVDREGGLEPRQGSEKHTEDHHLIRCLAPKNNDDALSSTERRLISLESRFGDLIQDLTTRIGNIEQLLHKLSSAETVA